MDSQTLSRTGDGVYGDAIAPARWASTFFAIYCDDGSPRYSRCTVSSTVWLALRSQRVTSIWDFTPVENVGLYWHLVDLVWIFLFPLLYLVK